MKKKLVLAMMLLAGCAQSSPPGAAPDPSPVAIYPRPTALRTLESAITDRIAQLDSGEVAIAFADLETGRRIGINDHTPLHAASTMKVPILIELFRQAEVGKLRLDDSVTVKNEFSSIAD